MRRDTSVIYFLPEGRSFLSREQMRRFIDEVVAQDFFVDFGNGRLSRRMIPQNPVDSSWRPGCSDSMEAYIEAFVSGEISHLAMFAYSIEREGPLGGFDFLITFEPTRCRVKINLTHIAFVWEEETRQQAFARWLNLFLSVYEIWHPAYGYCEPVDVEWPEPTQDDINLRRIPCLYEINFLGPAIVDHLGLERIFSIPAWKVQPLTDGGALIVPEAYFKQHDPSAWERATRHLDLPALVPDDQDQEE